jgi:hypothetical protein
MTRSEQRVVSSLLGQRATVRTRLQMGWVQNVRFTGRTREEMGCRVFREQVRTWVDQDGRVRSEQQVWVLQSNCR